ncbi:hypothetical protein B0H19DRAFT_1242721 [Mycena capillaripes]|nr:hypothetical protein B0H19DRAFT_1242721 [Mycena capillaripes]
MAELVGERLVGLVLVDLRTGELPPELWLEIVAHLGPGDLAAIALVSRALRGAAHSLMFRSCVFKLQYPHHLRSLIEFYTSSDVATKVHECTVLGHRQNSDADVARVCAAILHFSNLRQLVFQHVRVTATTVAAISSKALSSQDSFELSLISCITDFPVPSGHQEGIIPLKTFLNHNEPIPGFLHDNRWLPLLNLDVLRVLDIAQPHSTERLLEHFIRHLPGIKLPAVEVLRVHLTGLDRIADRFASALTKFPALRTLSLDCALDSVSALFSSPRHHAQISVNGDTVPLLSSFHGPLTHAAAYCTGRPFMRHLKLYGNHNTCDLAGLLPTLTQLARVVPQLTSLELRIDFPVEDLILPLASTFPALRSLRVVVPRYVRRGRASLLPEFADIMHTIATLRAASRLEVLYLTHRYGNPREPFGDVLQLSAGMAPTIRALAQRAPLLWRISVCCVLDPTAHEKLDAESLASIACKQTMVWRWTGDFHGGSMAQWSSAGMECINGRTPNLGVRESHYKKYTVADELDDEWLQATASHR